jgi:rod shape-determining protein MreD
MGDRPVRVFRIITVILLALTFVFMESAFTWPRRLFGAQVDLLPALMVFVSLRLGIGSIVVVALIGGLSMDALSLNPLGVSPLPLCLVGMLIHLKREQILRDEVVVQLLLGMAASAVVPLGTLLMILSVGESPLLGFGFVWDLLVMTIGGGIATPVIFKGMRLLESALTYQTHSQPSFRPDREIKRGRN